MLVSVCIPEYNAQRFIRQNLDSILGQTYPEIEIILADDASSDQTPAIMKEYAEKYPDKITALYSDVNQGSGATRNRAVAQAKGMYLFLSDCDDILKPNCIEVLMKKAEEDGWPDVVYDGFQRQDSEGTVLYNRKYRSIEEAKQQSVMTWAKIIKRSFLTRNGIKSPEAWFEDVLLHARILSSEPVCSLVDNCGYVYVKNKSSLSHTKLKGFYKNDADKGFQYLAEGYEKLQTEEARRLMMYLVMQYAMWYLLKSGTGVGGKVTVAEYQNVRRLLEQHFPRYKKLDYVSVTKPRAVRKSVKLAIYGTLLLIKMHLAKPFFYLYGELDLSRFWPEL